MDGLRADRCGSPSSSGWPDAVREPASATQFDPRPLPASPRSARSPSRPGNATGAANASAISAQASPVRIAVGGPGQPDLRHELVGVERRRAEDLREAASTGPAEEIELEEPVLRGGVALEDEQIVRRARVDVRDAEGIAHDLTPLVEPEEA